MVWYGMVSYGTGVDFLFFFWGGGEGEGIFTFLWTDKFFCFRWVTLLSGILRVITENVEFAIAGAILDTWENQSGAVFGIKNPHTACKEATDGSQHGILFFAQGDLWSIGIFGGLYV